MNLCRCFILGFFFIIFSSPLLFLLGFDEFEPFLPFFFDDDQIEDLRGMRRDDSGTQHYHEVNREFSNYVLSGDIDLARQMIEKHAATDVNYFDEETHHSHLLAALCSVFPTTRDEEGKSGAAGKMQTDLAMVDFLLSQPNIDPNGEDDALPAVSADSSNDAAIQSMPSPLEAALKVKNQDCVVRLIRHPRTVRVVHARHLTCDLIPHILPEILIGIEEDSLSCFLELENSYHQDPPRLQTVRIGSKRYSDLENQMKKVAIDVMEWEIDHRKGSLAQAPSSSSKGDKISGGSLQEEKNNNNNNAPKVETTTNNNNNQQKQNSVKSTSPPTETTTATTTTKTNKRRTSPWKLVLDPEEFDDAWDFAWFYVFGRDWADSATAVKWLIAGIAIHSLVVAAAGWFYLSTLEDNARVGIVNDVVTPPTTPQAGPAQQQQQQQQQQDLNDQQIQLPQAAVERN
jgi:hypothetical protein